MNKSFYTMSEMQRSEKEFGFIKYTHIQKRNVSCITNSRK